MDALLLRGARVAASQDLLRLLEFSSGRGWVLLRLLSKVVSVLSAEVASVVIISMTRNDSTETVVGGLNRTVDEGELSDVVLVDHAEDGLLFSHVHLGVLNFLLVSRLQLSLCSKRQASVRMLIGHAGV